MSTKLCSYSPDTKKDTFQWYKIRYSNRLKECGSSALIKVPYTSTVLKSVGSYLGAFNYGGVEYGADGSKAATVSAIPDPIETILDRGALENWVAPLQVEPDLPSAVDTKKGGSMAAVGAIVAIIILIMIILSTIMRK